MEIAPGLHRIEAPFGERYVALYLIVGDDAVLLVDTGDGRHREIPVEPGAGAYSCELPPDRFVDLVIGASTQNNSGPEVAARSVELIDAMHRSAALGGTQVSIGS